MTEKELRKLKRQDFLHLMLAQGKEIEALKAQLAEANAKLEDKDRQIARLMDGLGQGGSFFQDRRSSEGFWNGTEADGEAVPEVFAAMRDDLLFKIGEVVASAQTACMQMLEEAKRQAEATLDDAEQRRTAILKEARQQQDYIMKQAASSYARIKAQHMACLDSVDTEWQSLLKYLPKAGQDDSPLPEDSET